MGTLGLVLLAVLLIALFARRIARWLVAEPSGWPPGASARLRGEMAKRIPMPPPEFAMAMAGSAVEPTMIALVRSEVARHVLVGSGGLLPDQIYPQDRLWDDLLVDAEQLGFDIEDKAGVVAGAWFGLGDIPETHTVEELVRLCEERRREDLPSGSGSR